MAPASPYLLYVYCMYVCTYIHSSEKRLWGTDLKKTPRRGGTTCSSQHLRAAQPSASVHFALRQRTPIVRIRRTSQELLPTAVPVYIPSRTFPPRGCATPSYLAQHDILASCSKASGNSPMRLRQNSKEVAQPIPGLPAGSPIGHSRRSIAALTPMNCTWSNYPFEHKPLTPPSAYRA